MSKIIQINDQNELVDTKNFPHATFPFDKFNPVQSRIFEVYEKDANFLIAAATSAGKTVVAEQLLSYEVSVRGGKGLYLSPYKALTQEKVDDWGEDSHHFHNRNLSICTGDYRLTNERTEELGNAHLILATTELINSLTRNHTADKSDFLTKVKTAVCDEFHLLMEPNRGDKLEVGLVKLTAINPDIRIVGLSATMPNVEEVARWLSKLNGKDTYILNSTYRPCPLQTHYMTYNDSFWKYEAKENEKINTALDVLTTHHKDKFVVIVHSKKTGAMLMKRLKDYKIECEYHNADLDKANRLKIETKFRNDPKLRVLVATSGVGTGLNLPARRVIVLGVHAGLEEVPSYKIRQYVGRAGRPKYDTKGDAYVLLPQKDVAEHVERLKTVEPIKSQLIDEYGNFKVLAFHIISEIHHGDIKNREDIFKWYERTLASFQDQDLDHKVVDRMINALKGSSSIKENEDGIYEITPIGRIASLFYYSPFDVSDLNRNCKVLLDNKKQMDDYWIAFALASLDTNRIGVTSAAERDQIAEFCEKIPFALPKTLSGKEFTDSIKKVGYCYYCLLNGLTNPVMAGMTRGLQADFPRLMEVLFALDGMFKWNEKDYLKKLGKRISYGVDWNLIDLIALPGIGKVKAQKLWSSNVKTLQDVANKPNIVKIALNLSEDKVKELGDTASLMLNRG